MPEDQLTLVTPTTAARTHARTTTIAGVFILFVPANLFSVVNSGLVQLDKSQQELNRTKTLKPQQLQWDDSLRHNIHLNQLLTSTW